MKIGHVTLSEKILSSCGILVLGSAGYGKSMLLLLMMMHELANKTAFALFDMHAKLFQMVVRWCAYMGYLDRNIEIVNPADGRYVRGYDLARRREGIDLSVQVGGKVEATQAAWGDSENIGSFSNIFKLLTAMYTVILVKGLTLVDGFNLLTNKKKMSQAVADVKDPILEALWEDLMKLSPSEWTRQVSPTLTRVFRIIRSKAMQRFVCQHEKSLDLTFEDTLLVNLGKVGQIDHDAANVFAALMLNDFYNSSFLRERKGTADPKPYRVYVDEWTTIGSGADFGRCLAETRKQGLLLTLANQDLSQIRKKFGSDAASTTLSLCQVKIIFGGINEEDCARLARELQIDKSVLTGLRKRECVIKLPDEPATIVNVPNVLDPYVSKERLLAYEKQIAEMTGALPIEEVDRRARNDGLLVIPQDEDNTHDGWAIR